MKITTFATLIALSLAAPASAVLCALDEVPAATLLVPYFEVDLDACAEGGMNTLVKVTNTSATNTIVHLTFWTDWGAPVIDYDLYLTGFDVETLNLADHFCNGNISITGPGVNSHGDLSQDPSVPPGCDVIFPFPPNPVLTPLFLDRIRNAHTGQPVVSASSGCMGEDHGDNVARGYLTLDVVEQCNLLFPNEPDYFNGIASYQNKLLGELVLVDTSTGFYQSYPAVHLEADTAGTTFLPGDHTFYGRFVSALATDRREPLPTTFGASFTRLNETGTELLVWRESTGLNDPFGTACGGPPPEFPLATPDLLAFDEEENPIAVPLAVDLQTQRATLTDVLPPTSPAGWLRLDLRHNAVDAYSDDLAQAWVGTLSPRLAPPISRDVALPPAPSPPYAGFPAVALDNICADPSRSGVEQ